MSHVTDMFVIIGDSEDGYAEDIAPRVAEAIVDHIYDEIFEIPIISLHHKDGEDLQGGSKLAGSACIWFGWNHAHPDELADVLKRKGFKHITLWTHREFDGRDGITPKVVSW